MQEHADKKRRQTSSRVAPTMLGVPSHCSSWWWCKCPAAAELNLHVRPSIGIFWLHKDAGSSFPLLAHTIDRTNDKDDDNYELMMARTFVIVDPSGKKGNLHCRSISRSTTVLCMIELSCACMVSACSDRRSSSSNRLAAQSV
jgi:hypothetical protein